MKSFHDVGVSLDDLLQKSGHLIQVVGNDGQMLYVNRRWLNRLDYAEQDVDALNFAGDVLHRARTDDFEKALEHLVMGDVVSHVNIVLLTSTGQPVVVEGSLLPRMEGGELVSVVGVFQDVTDHHEFETELHRMFQLSVDMLGIIGYDGVFEKLNPAWERVLGYPIEKLIGRSIFDFVHPDDREATMKAAQAAQAGETIITFENRYRCNNGQYRWLSWHSAPYEDEAHFYCIARDVTHRKGVEADLQEARQQLRAILNNSGTLISMKDIDGRYLLVNQEFARRFGNGNRQDLIGLTDADLFEPEITAVLQENDAAVLKSSESMQFEEALPVEDGTNTYLSTKFALTNADGKPYAVCTIATDITYRKMTETQLLLRNQAIEHSPSGISIADASLPDMPLIYINPAFEKNTGYTALDAIGRNCRFLQADDRDQPEIAVLREAIANEETCTVVLRNYRKSGELFYNELSLAPIHNAGGELTHYVGISTDVTDRVEAEEKIQSQNQALLEANHELAVARKRTEEAARQITEQNEALVKANRELAVARKQAEEATRLKSQFLATMSHELRTPLNAIIGYTEIQLAGMTGDLTDEQHDYQERVLANADHLLDLINDVLDIAKIEAGRMEMLNKEFEVRVLLDDIVDQMQVLTDEKGLSLDVSLDERMPEKIVGDAARIRQITINLLSNAIKFTDEGTVRLQVRKHGRDAWKLIVSDNGIGIPSHMQETIFEEFRQVDGSSQRKAGGTGLGLSIVRKLALMMGGNVRLKSQMGEGSTFTIFLPLVEKTEKPVTVSDT